MIDAIDMDILACLKKNAREHASSIGQKINLSVSAVIERIRKLEAAGVIEQYTVVLDQRKLGNDVVALMEVSLEHPKHYDGFTRMIANNPNVVSCYYLTGEFDFMLKIVTDSSDHLEQIHRSIKSHEGVSATKTHFVLKTVKNDVG